MSARPTAAGTKPLPENVLSSPAASTSESSEPAKVVSVAHASATRYEAVREP